MSTVWIQQGTVLNLVQPLARAKQRVAKLYKKEKKDLLIMSGNDSDHMMDSKHFSDEAWDQAINGVSQEKVKNAANKVSKEDRITGVKTYVDIVAYPKKGIYHVEWDPK